MFHCDFCKKPSKPGEKPIRIIVGQRPKEYRDRMGKRSVGWETTKEVQACPECARKRGHTVQTGSPST